MFGFLGPNGAGKSTTQKIIVGLLKGYSGNVEILGKNLHSWKKDLYEKIGVCFELPNHYQKLTAYENLELFNSFYSRRTLKPMELLKMVELEKDANNKVSTFSKGMETKLNFAKRYYQNAPYDWIKAILKFYSMNQRNSLESINPEKTLFSSGN